MNDLERDLHELFDERARTIDPPMLAPTPVLRRGRRRQVRTAAGGVLAGVLAIAIAVAAIGDVRERADQPAAPSLGERTTSIGGVPVTAPAGWTLVDDWPLSNVLPTTSESCSFSGTGTPVEQNASSETQSQAAVATDQNGSCTTTETTYPTGIPVLQLANFEISLTETVCGLGDTQAPTDLPDDGVAVYVAEFQGAINTGTVLDACPGSENITDGESLETFADNGVSIVYAGVIVAGPSADDSDVAYAQAYLRSLGGLRVTPTPPSASGPGYVMAAGSSGDTDWRLEAGITSFDRQSGSASFGAALVTTNEVESSRTVEVPIDQPTLDDYVDLGADGGVQFGTAAADVSSIDIVGPSRITSAEMLAWPAGLRTLAGEKVDLQGRLWFAVVPERGSVQPHLTSETTASPRPVEAPTPAALRTRVAADGLYTVFGNDFGHDWSFTQDQHTDQLMFSLDGATPDEGYSLAPSGGTQIDIPGGTLLLDMRPTAVRSIWVTSDVPGTDVLAVGGVAHAAEYAAARSNIWVVALPGSGMGYVWESDRVLPSATDWPATSPMAPGDLVGSGSGPNVSWAMVWSTADGAECPRIEVVAATTDGDTGSSDCATAWNSQEYGDAVSSVVGVYGRHYATVFMTGPDGMLADVHAEGDEVAGGTCGGNVTSAGDWANTGSCVFVIPVGETWRIQPTTRAGDSIGDEYTIRARAGTIDMIAAGEASAPPVSP